MLVPGVQHGDSIFLYITKRSPFLGSILKSNLNYVSLIHTKERLGAGEGGDRGWDGWMLSPTQGTWVWAKLQQIMKDREAWHTAVRRIQRVRHDWVTEQRQQSQRTRSDTESGFTLPCYSLTAEHPQGRTKADRLAEKSGDAGSWPGKTAPCGHLVPVLVKVLLAWVPELPLSPW